MSGEPKEPGETVCDLCTGVFPTDEIFEFGNYELCHGCYEHVLIVGFDADEVVICGQDDGEGGNGEK